ncbi:hypothetical protein SLA2020_208600 [Shorea laevis]
MKLGKQNWITIISGKTERQPGIGTRRLKTRRIVRSRRNCTILVIARVWIRRILRDNRVAAAKDRPRAADSGTRKLKTRSCWADSDRLNNSGA